jgi:hypothetical protein
MRRGRETSVGAGLLFSCEVLSSSLRQDIMSSSKGIYISMSDVSHDIGALSDCGIAAAGLTWVTRPTQGGHHV